MKVEELEWESHTGKGKPFEVSKSTWGVRKGVREKNGFSHGEGKFSLKPETEGKRHGE